MIIYIDARYEYAGFVVVMDHASSSTRRMVYARDPDSPDTMTLAPGNWGSLSGNEIAACIRVIQRRFPQLKIKVQR